MCNFYIMYYTHHHELSPYHECEKAAPMSLSRQAPKATNTQSTEDIDGMVSHGDDQFPNQDVSQKEHQQPNQDPFKAESNKDQSDTQVENTENIRQDTSNSKLSTLKLVPNWPAQFFLTGDIAGVTVSDEGNVFIFHRSDRHWGKR